MRATSGSATGAGAAIAQPKGIFKAFRDVKWMPYDLFACCLVILYACDLTHVVALTSESQVRYSE